MKLFLQLSILVFGFLPTAAWPQPEPEKSGFVAVMEGNLMILPGTSEYLKSSIKQASLDGAKILVVKLDTPGGMLNTTQEMIREIFNSDIPVIIYVTPAGASAASAGAFITLAGHIAAMTPGTSIGAAHPVTGEGKDIEGDMRKKAENLTVAMIKSISEERGRNVSWAEKAIRDSSSLTEKEALKMNVVDFVADDLDNLLGQIKGKKVKIRNTEVIIGDYTKLAKRVYDISFKQKTINTLAYPNVLALLWMGATTGLAIELYNPGAVLPAVVGLICLVLALAMSQVIPITQGGVLLLVLGALMIGAEFFITSGALGVGGVIALILGSIYLIDSDLAPGLSVSLEFIIPTAIFLGSFVLFLAYKLAKSAAKQAVTGSEALAGKTAKALANFSGKGKVFVDGEVWHAELASGFAEKGELLKILDAPSGLLLKVEKFK